MSDATSWWGAITGTLGIGLGIFNTLKAHADTKPRLKVQLTLSEDQSDYWWVAANLSGTPITLKDAFIAFGKNPRFTRVILTDGENGLPREIVRPNDHGIRLSALALGLEINHALHVVAPNTNGAPQVTDVDILHVHFILIDTLDNVYDLRTTTLREILTPANKFVNGQSRQKPAPQTQRISQVLRNGRRLSESMCHYNGASLGSKP